MANVTYLLGAGASYNALPVIDEIPKAIGGVIGGLIEFQKKNLEEHKKRMSLTASISENFDRLNNAISESINDLTSLQIGCQHHMSIDTYAKMLFLTKDITYENTKCTIALFFELYSFFKENEYQFFDLDPNYRLTSIHNSEYRKKDSIDKRYDAFLASILNTSYDSLPDNIKIISWNYDDQLEKSYQNYLDVASNHLDIDNHKNYSDIDRHLNVYQRNQINKTIDENRFCTVKINGSAKFINTQEDKLVYDFYHEKHHKQDIKNCLLSYSHYKNNSTVFKVGISFAWDNPIETKELLQKIKSISKNTHYLVVIGYSFPFFNRQVDKEIIQNMNGLRKIYIQDPNADEIMDRVKAIRTEYQDPSQANRLVAVKNTKQFYLPDELT